MIDFDNLTDRQRSCIPDVHFELIPIKNLVSNQDYQRDPPRRDIQPGGTEPCEGLV